MRFPTTRRSALLGALATAPLFLLGGCSTGTALADVQGYAATAVAALAKVVPLVETLDPALTTQLNTVLSDVETAEQAFAALTSATGAASTAQALLSLLNEAFSLVEDIPGIPVAYVAGIQAAQILLVAIGAFFGISLSAAAAMASRATGRSAVSLQNAVSQYMAVPASGRKKYADTAKARVQAWMSTLPPT
jgi:hypothetical protein